MFATFHRIVRNMLPPVYAGQFVRSSDVREREHQNLERWLSRLGMTACRTCDYVTYKDGSSACSHAQCPHTNSTAVQLDAQSRPKAVNEPLIEQPTPSKPSNSANRLEPGCRIKAPE